MKIIDCFIYNNEDLILELRLNFLNKYVDKFILVEAKFDHSGKLKNKFNFDISKFEKFRNKIEYLNSPLLKTLLQGFPWRPVQNKCKLVCIKK